jgi:hypothetical protein
MAETPEDFSRYYAAFDEVFDDPTAPFSSNTEACRAALDQVIALVRKYDQDTRLDRQLSDVERIRFDPTGLDEASYRQGYADSSFAYARQILASIKTWHHRGRESVAYEVREHAKTTGSMHPCDHFLLGLECAARIAEKEQSE